MPDNILGFLGIMRNASALQIGEEGTGEAVKAGKARLLMLASDASPNAVKRAESFCYGRSVISITLPYTKEELSDSLGSAGCSMLAVTELGFANALLEKLAAKDEAYLPPAATMREKIEKITERRSKKPGRKAVGKEKRRN